MAKTEVTQWDTTAANNLDVNDISLAENVMRPPAVNNAFREMMAQIRRMLNSSVFRLFDTTDTTKKLAFDLSGLTSGTTTLKVPNASGTIALTDSLPVGQCRIALSGGNIVLSPYSGDKIRIAGAVYAIPSAGVSLAPTGLSTATDLNVYVYMNAGTMTLEAVATAHALDTTAGNVGVRIKSSDSTRTLVGKVRLDTGPVFVDSAAKRFVLNWFNRQAIGVLNNFTADRTTASTPSFAEVNSEIRCEFLSWPDEAVSISLSGAANNSTAGRGVITTVGVDGVNAESVQSYSTSPSAGADYGFSVMVFRHSVTEGYHFYTLLGRTDGVGTATYRSNAAANGRTLLTVMTRG